MARGPYGMQMHIATYGLGYGFLRYFSRAKSAIQQAMREPMLQVHLCTRAAVLFVHINLQAHAPEATRARAPGVVACEVFGPPPHAVVLLTPALEQLEPARLLQLGVPNKGGGPDSKAPVLKRRATSR